ncbi:MAG: transglutaminase-like domain-containing protein [Phreatobacter sp.]
MIIQVAAELDYSFDAPTQVILDVLPANAPDQTILEESLTLTDGAWQRDIAPDGRRRLRGVVAGRVSIAYRGTIDNGSRLLLPPAAHQSPWTELPDAVLPFLLPSRYCPSDRFARFAGRTFGGAGDGVALVMAVMDWLAEHVDYVPGSSAAHTGAEHTFTTRSGVCRDFTHLAITFCRALGIPARAVGAYAVDLDPPDFHAVTEVYLDGAWWLVDPTRLAPVAGLVRIADGRDAADIAFMTSDGPATLLSQAVMVSRQSAQPVRRRA